MRTVLPKQPSIDSEKEGRIDTPPQHRMRGGDRPRGGVPSATGHAGRRLGIQARVWMLIAIFVSFALASSIFDSSHVVFAASGKMPENVTFIHGNELRDGYDSSRWLTGYSVDVKNTVTYCLQPGVNAPAGGQSYTLTNLSDALSQKKQHAIRLCLYYGYGGKGYDAKEFKAHGIPHFLGDGTPQMTTSAWDAYAVTHFYLGIAFGHVWKETDYYKPYYQEFIEWADAKAREDNKRIDDLEAYVFNQVDANSQTMVSCVIEQDVPDDSGHVSLKKISSNSSITKGNACYDLSGATYRVYADKDCTEYMGSAYDLVTNKSGASKEVEIPLGTYWVKEYKAPKGFDVDKHAHKVDVTAEGTTLELEDAPTTEGPEVWASKRDAHFGSAQGEASLEGAEFTIRYYDGTYSVDDLPATPMRTWTLKSDAEGTITPSEGNKVSGDDFYTNEKGEIVFPIGTITIQETKAPAGYLLEGQSDDSPSSYEAPIHITHVSGTGSYAAPVANETIIRGGVAVGKVSRETGQHLSQGEATLAGAQFDVTYQGAGTIQVLGNSYQKGDVVARLVTDEEGKAQSQNHLLPYGTYSIRETKAPTGFFLDEGWKKDFSIRVNGEVHDFSSEQDSAQEQVFRGGFYFNKADEQTMERMEGVAFRITSKTTGECHVIVADENGIVDTETVPHSHLTNANDAAVVDGTLNEELLDAGAGIWFSGRVDCQTSPDDTLCALPYDSYTVEELPCSANEGRELVSFDIKVHKHDKAVDMGTVDDSSDELPDPHMSTTLTYDEREHIAPVDAHVTLVDTIQYENLVVGNTYTATGTLVFVDDGSSVLNGDGSPVYAESAFDPTTSSGTVDVAFDVDTSALAGRTVVAFESLLCNGDVVCTHEDLKDVGQTVWFPDIGTTLTDDSGVKEVQASERVTLVDTVSYANLIPGKSYEAVGTLMDKTTGEAIVDDSGHEVTASTQFVPTEPSGTVEVTFVFNGVGIAGKRIVAFESLRRNGIELVTHADLEDEDQTVTVPKIGTQMGGVDDTHEAPIDEELSLTDVVLYEGLQVGQTYTLRGTLMDKASASAITDKDGTPLTASCSFTPESPDGTTELTFVIDASKLGGRTLVAFETLLVGTETDERIVATHEDLDSADQTVTIPQISTSLVDAQDKDKEVVGEGTIKLVDVVTYQNLCEGVSYTMTGTLYDKTTKKPIAKKDGTTVTSTKTFVCEQPDGTVELEFSFDASLLRGNAIVAFESCMRDKREVATHADINDASQTVRVTKPNKPDEKKGTPSKASTNTPASSSSAQYTKSRVPSTGDVSVSGIALAFVGVLALGAGVAYATYKRFS